MTKVYQQLAGSLNAYNNCVERGNYEWKVKHAERIEQLVKEYLPSGSGIDNGIRFDFDNSKDDLLVLNSSFHCMNEHGYYDGWVDFTVKVKPSLQFGTDLKITGKFGKYADVKDYLCETIDYALNQDLKEG